MIPTDFALGFASYRRMLASAKDDAVKVKIVEDCAYQSAKAWIGNGLMRPDAVDEIHDMAVCVGLGDSLGNDRLTAVIGAALQRGEQDRDVVPPVKTNGHAKPEAITAVNPFPIDAKSLPRRPWLVPGLLLRGQVTLFVAPPGSGKSLLTLQLAMVCSCGIAEWSGWRPRGCYRTLIINVEEDETEMRRRLFGAALKMGIDQRHISGVLLAKADSIVVAKADNRTKTVTATPMLDRIIETILVNKIDIVVVDPFAETFAGDENSNSELKWAGVLWREVARRTKAAVILVHHAKKYAQHMAGDMDAGRGGGSLAGVARIVATLFSMTEEEATTFKIDVEERSRFIRFDDAKANLSVLHAGARWFEKHSLGLGNAGDGLPEDEVGVLVPWEAPDPFKTMTTMEANKILDLLKEGVKEDDGRPTGDPYSMERRGGSKRWAGNVVQDVLQCDEKAARKVLDAWLKNEVIEEYQAKISTSKGALRGCLRVKDSMRPGAIVEESFL
jgi:RecA/RadA recombinase